MATSHGHRWQPGQVTHAAGSVRSQRAAAVTFRRSNLVFRLDISNAGRQNSSLILGYLSAGISVHSQAKAKRVSHFCFGVLYNIWYNDTWFRNTKEKVPWCTGSRACYISGSNSSIVFGIKYIWYVLIREKFLQTWMKRRHTTAYVNTGSVLMTGFPGQGTEWT